MLISTLTDAGLGAKRRAGYGYFLGDDSTGNSGPCHWVDETIARLMQENRAREEDTLRGKTLAEEWQKIQNDELKQQALNDIRSRWEARGWWDQPTGKAARQARAIYEQTVS